MKPKLSRITVELFDRNSFTLLTKDKEKASLNILITLLKKYI